MRKYGGNIKWVLVSRKLNYFLKLFEFKIYFIKNTYTIKKKTFIKKNIYILRKLLD